MPLDFSKRERAAALAAGLSALTLVAHAQTDQRVEITGSAIRRVDAEGALPVQVLKREDIERSGARTASELIQSLPVFQGATVEGSSVGGGGSGFTGASLRNQGETRTLVLLNGRRVAPSGSQALTGAQAAVNLNNLPLAAVERIEILTDGASALYGSDAIGGVVNFITRRDVSFVEVNAGYSSPDGGKGNEAMYSVVAGFGSLTNDGFNVLLAASRNDRKPLGAVDREFAKTGRFDFSANGKDYTFELGSPVTIPANVALRTGRIISPAFYTSGKCPEGTFFLASEGACYYDFARQLEIYPEAMRDNLLLSGTKMIGEHRLSIDLMHSKTATTSRLAPPPGNFTIAADSPLAQAVRDAAAAAGLPPPEFPVTAAYRVADVGKRTTRDTMTAVHADISLQGTLGAFDYNMGYVASQSKYEEILTAGWVRNNAFTSVLRSGKINPFLGPGQQTPEVQKLLDDAVIRGKFDGGVTRIDQFHLRASRPLFKLGGGESTLAFGVEHLNEKFDKNPSELAQGRGENGGKDTRFGDTSAIVPYNARRSSTSLFGEWLLPLVKGLELTPAVRHDRYDDVGDTTNYKLSLRWQPSAQWLVRGSAGTGFKAPTVPQLNATLQSFGVTGGTYSCNANAALAAVARELGVDCPSAGARVQFNVLAGGNQDLKPERSKQWTVGLRFEPTANISLGVDAWGVEIKDSIGQISEQVVFADPQRFRNQFARYVDPTTGQNLIAWLANNVNLGESETRGIDIDAQARFATPAGRFTSRLMATHLLKNKFEVVPGEGFLTNLGVYANGNVAFRWQTRWTQTLEHGAWVHTLAWNYRSGYADDITDVLIRGTTQEVPVERRVSSYSTLDWQTGWNANKNLRLVLGVQNLLNQDPPLTITQNGGGQMVGFDSRYADARGRMVYVQANYRF